MMELLMMISKIHMENKAIDKTQVSQVLKDAASVGMMTAYHNYLITNFDLHLVDLDDFKYGGTNITAFRLVDPAHPEVV